MFTNGLIVLNQMVIMALLVAAGYALYRYRIFNNDTTQSMSNLLSKFVIPCAIVASFQRAFDINMAKTLGITFLSAILMFLVAVTISRFLYGPGKFDNYADRQMCAIFSNNGFMALPLLNAMFGDYGVFLATGHIVCMAVVVWTYGVFLLEGDKYQFSLKKILLNPGIVGMYIGVALFCSPVKLPDTVYTTVSYIAQLNTPIAMFVLGCFLAQLNLIDSLKNWAAWRVSLVRLLLIPAVSMLVLYFIPLEMTAKITLLVGVAAPTAIISAMFAQIYKTDYLFSTQVIALSTISSIITLPGLITFFEISSQWIG
ncbi:AEC family transporter [Fusibacter paucivorans]|uniref:AEC family transporter n=1 Tax=Fusibacter paucivorans TaxID=76009 RepID=A0ABS5PSH5_9FIRM|nr:AEC family transporter [Fusibacter paucivorans]MBS7527862.1 AEC family transporter [Fusibacter paucivorans]